MIRSPREARSEWLFMAACLTATVLPLLLVAGLFLEVVWVGLHRINVDFLTSFPSRDPNRSGILAGLVGSLWLLGLTAVLAVPIGFGSAIYLEEYAERTSFSRLIDANIDNLSSVPSIIYGLLGLEIFVRTVGLGRSVLAGGLTLALLVLPLIITTSRQALRAVPEPLRDAGWALGLTRWQMVRRVVLPLALPRMLTGAIAALARALGETAPLVALGALTYVDFLPNGLSAPFTALPIQIFHWVTRGGEGFVLDAAAGIVVLLVLLALLHTLAFALQRRFTPHEAKR